MKTLAIIASVSFAGALFAFSEPKDAYADGNDRLNQCAWYKSQAKAAARNGQNAAAEANWRKYNDCLKKRID